MVERVAPTTETETETEPNTLTIPPDGLSSNNNEESSQASIPLKEAEEENVTSVTAGVVVDSRHAPLMERRLTKAELRRRTIMEIRAVKNVKETDQCVGLGEGEQQLHNADDKDTNTAAADGKKPSNGDEDDEDEEDKDDEEDLWDEAEGINHGFSSRKQTIIQFNKKLDYKSKEVEDDPRISHEVVRLLQWVLGYSFMVSGFLSGIGYLLAKTVSYVDLDENNHPRSKQGFSWSYTAVIFFFVSVSTYTYSVYANLGKRDRRGNKLTYDDTMNLSKGVLMVSVLFFLLGFGLYILFDASGTYYDMMYYFVDYGLFGLMFGGFALAYKKVVNFSIYR